MKNIIWTLFFSLYWTSYNINKKTSSHRKSAIIFLTNALWLLFCSLFQLYFVMGYTFPILLIFLSVIFLGLLSYFLVKKYFNEKSVEIQIDKYKYLSTDKYKSKRFVYILTVSIIAIAMFDALALLRNK